MLLSGRTMKNYFLDIVNQEFFLQYERNTFKLKSYNKLIWYLVDNKKGFARKCEIKRRGPWGRTLIWSSEYLIAEINLLGFVLPI